MPVLNEDFIPRGHITNFAQFTAAELKAMVAPARPDQVEAVAGHWQNVFDALAGEAEDGSIKALLDKAVADVLEYWSGEAAERFSEKAAVLSTALGNCARYACNTSRSLQGAADSLRQVKQQVEAVPELGSVAQIADRDFAGAVDSTPQLEQDLAGGMGAWEAGARSAETLTLQRQMALLAAGHMESLGASYVSWSHQLQDTPSVNDPTNKGFAPPESVVPPVPPVQASVPPPQLTRAAQTAITSQVEHGHQPTEPLDTGIQGGRQAPLPPPLELEVATNVDGVRGGIPSTPVDTKPSGPEPVRGPAAPSGNDHPPAFGTRSPGPPAGQRPVSLPSETSPSHRGPLGRPPHSPAVGDQSPTRGPQGGSGLHRSRGAVPGGAVEPSPQQRAGRPMTPHSPVGDTTERRSLPRRPDYLVEDDETWAPRRESTPRNID